MIALLFLLITFFASFGITQALFPKLKLEQKIGAAMVISILSSSWLALGFIAMLGYQAGLLTVFCICGYLALTLRPKKITVPSFQLNKAMIIFLIWWLVVFGWLFHKTFFLPSAEGLNTLPYSYGDLALHSTYINYFSQQTELSLVSPIFSQQSIKYPFMFDFYTALLVKMGLTIRTALLISSYSVVIPMLLFLYSICFSITQKVITPVFASVLLFLNGGLGFLKFFSDWKETGLKMDTFITHLPIDYTNSFEDGYYWSNIVTTHLLPQRGFFIGLTFLLMFINFWQGLWSEKKLSFWQMICVSGLVGMMPLFHLHTYLVCLPLLVWFLGWLSHQKRISVRNAVLISLPAIILGGSQLLIFAGETGFLSLVIGWIAGQQIFIKFWWQNMGLAVIFVSIAAVLFWKIFKRESFEQLLGLPSVAIFILCNIFVFQPNQWDNMKFFLLGYSLTCILTAAVLTHYWKSNMLKVAITLLLTSTAASGILSILFISQNSYNLSTHQDLQVAEAIKDTPADSIFLTSDIHNHPVTMLAGRAVVRGYRGWLWTHGIDYTAADADIENIYRGVTATDLLKKYSVDYVYIGLYEKKQYRVNIEFFRSRYTPIYQDETTTIYKISEVNLGQLPQL